MTMKTIKAKILLVEDDENLGFILKDYLELMNFDVQWLTNGNDAFIHFKQNEFDICIIDVMLPLKDGFTLAKEIREMNKRIPIVFLTAKQMKEDRIRGFELGADDYITKPFSTEELKLRIEAILRRSNNQLFGEELPSIYEIGSFIFNYNDHTLNHEGDIRRLTKKEAEVLNLLCQSLNKLVRRDKVLKAVWGKDDYFMGRSMDVYITRLRKYLKADSRLTITNIHGTGFKLEVRKDDE